MSSQTDVTRLLIAHSEGRADALDRLLPLIYDELRDLAAHHLRRERPGHTLNTTALVHEAYLRLVDQNRATWQNRAHFFSIASHMMRRILISYARKHNAEKRGGDAPHTLLDDKDIAVHDRAVDLISLDEALERLGMLNERLVQIVEHRYFGGLTIEETAVALDVSTMTVKRDWNKAKAWLYRELRAA